MKRKGTPENPYTHEDLSKALRSVLHKGQHWKDEIDHPCPNIYKHKVVSEAIAYICGSEAEFYKKKRKWAMPEWWVYAEGYWKSVGT